MESGIEVIGISLSGQLRIIVWQGWDCYDDRGIQYSKFEPWIQMNRFLISNTRNKFTAVGCDTYATVKRFGTGRGFTTGCMSLCDSINNTINGSCSGIGCCQTSIPQGVGSYQINISSYNNHSSVQFNPCSFAFVAEEGSYDFFSTDLANYLRDSWEVGFPLVLDWAVGYERCDAAKKNQTSYACKSTNSVCYETSDFDYDPGYHCNCSKGYEGNSYLPNGCQDIDECNLSIPCYGDCVNSPGSYTCSCPKGYEGDATKNGGCRRIGSRNKSLPLIVGVSSGLGALILIIGCWAMYKMLKKRNNTKRKEKFFKRNGGLLLQRQLFSNDDNGEKIKLFKSKELEMATDHYNDDRILGQGGQGTVYKGMLSDGRIVAIKKSKIVDEQNVEQFINEVFILSQINHRNVVKLLGCCLETEVPLLIYEFVQNGTLFNLIHDPQEEFPLSWEMRLRIATEVAGALSYLHYAASIPIYHRDIKSTNILLDEKYRAKVSDFGTSRSVSTDQTHLTTIVKGTFGYLDPEYFQSSQFTEKSDVYSFGVVIVELLTGQRAISSNKSQENKSLATSFIQSMEDNHLFEILDPRIIKEGWREEMVVVAHLAKRCLNLNGKNRPTMKDVEVELEGIRMSRGNYTTQPNYEEVKYNRTDLVEAWDVASTSTGTYFDSTITSSLKVNPLLLYSPNCEIKNVASV